MSQYCFDFIESKISSEIKFNNSIEKWVDNWPNCFEEGRSINLPNNDSLFSMAPPNIIILQGENGINYFVKKWAQRLSAKYIDISDNNLLYDNEFDFLLNKYFVIENIEQTPNAELLFHFYNLVKENQCYLMLTTSRQVNGLFDDLPDLRSRLMSCPIIESEILHDDKIEEFLIDLFKKKQLNIKQEVINYLLLRIERTIENIYYIINQVDKYSLEMQRAVTIPFLKRILDIK
ncbi:MAG: hypothetical protein AAF195_03390 [Pseudomonadota bacterium]